MELILKWLLITDLLVVLLFYPLQFNLYILDSMYILTLSRLPRQYHIFSLAHSLPFTFYILPLLSLTERDLLPLQLAVLSQYVLCQVYIRSLKVMLLRELLVLLSKSIRDVAVCHFKVSKTFIIEFFESLGLLIESFLLRFSCLHHFTGL